MTEEPSQKEAIKNNPIMVGFYGLLIAASLWAIALMMRGEGFWRAPESYLIVGFFSFILYSPAMYYLAALLDQRYGPKKVTTLPLALTLMVSLLCLAIALVLALIREFGP